MAVESRPTHDSQGNKIPRFVLTRGLANTGKWTLFRKRNPAIIELIRRGHYMDDAARKCGVNERTVDRWIERGRAAAERMERGEKVTTREQDYAEFYMRIMQADAEATDEMIGAIRSQAHERGGWIAAMTFLERRHPAKWRRRDSVEHTGPEGKPLPAVPHDNERVIQIINVLVDNRLLPPELASTLRNQLAGPVIDATAQQVHPAPAVDQTTGGPDQ